MKPHRNFPRQAASISPKMKRMDMTGLNSRQDGYLTRHRDALHNWNLQTNFANSMDFGKMKDPLVYSMAPSPHCAHSGRSVSLAMLILPGSSDKLGQAQSFAQLKVS